MSSDRDLCIKAHKTLSELRDMLVRRIELQNQHQLAGSTVDAVGDAYRLSRELIRYLELLEKHI